MSSVCKSLLVPLKKLFLPALEHGRRDVVLATYFGSRYVCIEKFYYNVGCLLRSLFFAHILFITLTSKTIWFDRSHSSGISRPDNLLELLY